MSKLNYTFERLIERVGHSIAYQLGNLGFNLLVNLVTNFVSRVMGDLEVRCFYVEVVQINVFGLFVENIVIKWFFQSRIIDPSVTAFGVLLGEEALLVVVVVSVTVKFATLVEVSLKFTVK